MTERPDTTTEQPPAVTTIEPAPEAQPAPAPFDSGYDVRALNNGDTFKIAAMLAKASSDPRILQAANLGDTQTVIIAAAAAVMDVVPRDLQLWLADLAGLRVRDYWRDAKQRLTEEAQDPATKRFVTPPPTDRDIRTAAEDDVMDAFALLPPGAGQDILTEVISRDDFLSIWRSSEQLANAARGRFGNLAPPSSGNGDGGTASS